jgi:hypothetical protein
VTVATVYDPVSDALATPFASLPPSIRFTGLLSYRDRPYGDFTLDFSYDPPPTAALTAQVNGRQVQMTATASGDTQRVEFWVDWVRVAVDTTPPFAALVDLDSLATTHGDLLPKRKFSYLYARAFDGITINAGLGEGNAVNPGYAQRAYSTVIEIGPEAQSPPKLLGVTTTSVPLP